MVPREVVNCKRACNIKLNIEVEASNISDFNFQKLLNVDVDVYSFYYFNILLYYYIKVIFVRTTPTRG